MGFPSVVILKSWDALEKAHIEWRIDMSSTITVIPVASSVPKKHTGKQNLNLLTCLLYARGCSSAPLMQFAQSSSAARLVNNWRLFSASKPSLRPVPRACRSASDVAA